MNRVRFYVDEDAMDDGLIAGLRLEGFDVESAKEAGLVEVPDEEHLDHASNSGRAMYTFNQGDFANLHRKWLASGRRHAGIVIGAQQRYSVGEQIRRLSRIVAAVSATDLANRIEFLGSWGPR